MTAISARATQTSAVCSGRLTGSKCFIPSAFGSQIRHLGILSPVPVEIGQGQSRVIAEVRMVMACTLLSDAFHPRRSRKQTGLEPLQVEMDLKTAFS